MRHDEAALQARRPTAPNLQTYRPTLSMVMSIAHRVTGVAVYLGMVLAVWWLAAVAAGPEAYAAFQGFMSSAPGLVLLLGLTWALLHHAAGGVRHLIWDTGKAHDWPSREYLVWATLIASIVLTILVWIAGWLA